jgi:hypothetical protein
VAVVGADEDREFRISSRTSAHGSMTKIRISGPLVRPGTGKKAAIGSRSAYSRS